MLWQAQNQERKKKKAVNKLIEGTVAHEHMEEKMKVRNEKQSNKQYITHSNQHVIL